MSAISETRPALSQRLALSRNGWRTLTAKGVLAHELVQKDRVLRNSRSPGIPFAMSSEITSAYSQRISELSSLLNLPEDPIRSRRRIAEYRRRLTSLGFPHWREIK